MVRDGWMRAINLGRPQRERWPPLLVNVQHLLSLSLSVRLGVG